MIITCPNCSSKFKVDDALLQKMGVKMRCSVCSNIFSLANEPDLKTGPEVPFIEEPEPKDISGKTDAPGDAAPIETGITYTSSEEPVTEQKPATKKHKPASLKNTLTGLLVIMIIALALFLSYYKGALNFFGNKQDTQPKQVETFPFSIRDADTTFKMLSTDDQGQVLVIKGIVKKNIKKPLKNLQIEIRILDKNRQVIATKTVYAGNIPIDADFNSKKEPDIDAILMDGSKTLGVLSQMDEIPFSVAFYGTQALSTASIQAEVKEFVWQ